MNTAASVLLCIRHPTLSVEALCIHAVRPSRPFVRSSGQILLPRHLMRGLSNLDQTYEEQPLALDVITLIILHV